MSGCDARRDWDLLGGWIRIRAGAGDVSYSGDGAVSGSGGVRGEDREVP